MWILTGPFDVDEHELSTKKSTWTTHLPYNLTHSFVESKLLKAGVTYILGRKEDTAQLVIRKKNISRAHFKIIVVDDDDADYVSLLRASREPHAHEPP